MDGICPEAVEFLRNKHVPVKAFRLIKKMKPVRQAEVAELMIAAKTCPLVYVKALLTATDPQLLVGHVKAKSVDDLTFDQMGKMEREMDSLQRDLKAIEASHGNTVLHLVLATGYLQKLFNNAEVNRYLTQHHREIFEQLQKVAQSASMDNQAAP